MKIKNICILTIMLISIISIIPASADTTYHYLGYDKIVKDDNTSSTIFGVDNYVRYDGVIEPKSLIEKGTIHYPYKIEVTENNMEYTIGNDTVKIPKMFDVIEYENKISPKLTYSKTQLINNMVNHNATVAYLVFPYSLNKVKTYSDENNISLGRWNFKAGREHITIYDNNETINYLSPEYYNFKIVNDEIRLYFVKSEANNLIGDITFEMHSWSILDYTNFGSFTYNNTTHVQSTNKIELSDNNNNYVLRYRLDEGAGTTAHDENLTNANDGTLYGGSSFNIYGASLDGTDDYIQSGISNTLNLQENATIMCWLNTSALPDSFGIMNVFGTGGGSSNIAIWNDNPSFKAIREDENDINYVWDTTYDFSTGKNGEWLHVALRDNGTYYNSYIDGVEYSTSGTHSFNLDTANPSLYIGRDFEGWPSGDNYFNGIVKDIRVYGYALTSAQINDIYNNTHKSTGDIITQIYDSGAGYIIQDVGINGTFTAEQTADIYINSSPDNITWSGYQLVKNDAVSESVYTIPTIYKKRYYNLKITLDTDDDTKTPILETIRTNTAIESVEEYEPIQNLTATPYIDYALIEWENITIPDYYNVYRIEPSILFTNETIVLDGILDGGYENIGQRGLLKSPNPEYLNQYDTIYTILNTTHIFMFANAHDDDASAIDDSIEVYFDFEKDGLTTDDKAYIIKENDQIIKQKWSGSQWISDGVSDADGIVSGSGTNNTDYELFIPLSELPELTYGEDINLTVRHKNTYSADTESYFPNTAYSIDNATGWQNLFVENSSTSADVLLFNTTNTYFSLMGLSDISWYRVGVSAKYPTGESNITYVEFITNHYPEYFIDGYIFDSNTSIGIGNSLVTITDTFTSGFIFTDINGYYKFDGLRNDTYTIEASATGYDTNNIKTIINGNNATAQNILLDFVSYTIDDVYNLLLEMNTDIDNLNTDIDNLNLDILRLRMFILFGAILTIGALYNDRRKR